MMTGAAFLLPIGALLGVLAPGVGNVEAGATGALLGALAGALGGRLLARRLSADDFEPERSERPYVGARSPDSDG